jgi:transposase
MSDEFPSQWRQKFPLFSVPDRPHMCQPLNTDEVFGIHNFLCWIEDWRRIATRYDKLARNFLAATTLVSVFY